MWNSGILVIGAGVVGRATAALLAEGGCAVFGFDPNPEAAALFPGTALSREDCHRDWGAIVLCVPTPETAGRMDARPLSSAIDLVSEIVHAGSARTPVAIRSTLVPGTMDRLVRPSLQPMLAQEAIQVCHWPSFARERQAAIDELSPRTIVVGRFVGDVEVEQFMDRALAHLVRPISYVRPIEAELIKHGANLFNSLKISFFNALADWSMEREADGHQVASLVAAAAEAAWNPAYGTRVGPAFGGACLPKDLAALAGQLFDDGSSHLGLLDAIREINADPRRLAGNESRMSLGQ